ncbi:hypothetical protein CaCOL14_012785 [Colletotrichum acutatum]
MFSMESPCDSPPLRATQEKGQPNALDEDNDDVISDSSESNRNPDYWEHQYLDLPLQVSIGRFEFERFKNRWDQENGYHVVELLICSENTAKEEIDERSWRNKHFERRSQLKSLSRNRPEPALTNVDNDRPQVFFRPFKYLIHHHSYMKAALKNCEDGISAAARRNGTRINNLSDTNIVPEESERSENLTGPMALEHLRCYIKFMDDEVMPLMDEFKGTDHHMIRFDDLWYLYELGDVIIAPPPSKSTDVNEEKRRYQTAFMLHTKTVHLVEDSKPNDITPGDCDCRLQCFYVDYDGDSFGPVMHTFKIKSYTGRKDIRDLPAYPIRFATDQNLVENLRTQGSMFRRFACGKHVSCDGWTLINNPMGQDYSEGGKTPEHIDGDVIVDFSEALSKHRSWKPEMNGSTDIWPSDSWLGGRDEIEILHWPHPNGKHKVEGPLFRLMESTQRDDDTEKRLSDSWVEMNDFLQAYFHKGVRSLDNFEHTLYDLILPRRVFVYVLRLRRFVPADVLSFRENPPQPDIFSKLEIDKDHRYLIQALVTDHFEKQRVQHQQPSLIPLDQDLIRGKGSGLFILLHGVPGVGKTATAEAIAQANNKPLFAITCGDLGISAEAVEMKLNEIFRLAHIWDCVLLLDEADIFLAKRDKDNLERNAIVSVFLRVLEYYKGILFLTTNRVGTMDEAFKSRLHISLYYEPLDETQTRKIFDLNIIKLQEIERNKLKALKSADKCRPRLVIDEASIREFAWEHFLRHEKTPHLRWNGRQIRNAFQIASSLAFHEALQEPGSASSEQIRLG